MPEERTLSMAEAVKEMGISERTLRNRIKTGKVAAEKETLPRGGSAWKIYPDRQPTAPTVSERQPAGIAPATDRMAEMQEEIRFLRALVEARDRDAAELRTALRKALELAPKALPTGNGTETTRQAEPETNPQEIPATIDQPETDPTPARQEQTATPQAATPLDPTPLVSTLDQSKTKPPRGILARIFGRRV